MFTEEITNEEKQPEIPENAILDFPTLAREAMLKTAIKNPLNAHLFDDPGEANYQPSLTIPDQAMSIREIMERYARGLPLDNVKVPIYNGEDDDFPDLAKMDLADRQAYIESKELELRELKNRIKAQDEQQKLAMIQKLREEEREKLQKEMADKGGNQTPSA